MLKITKLNRHCTLVSPNRPEIWKCNALVIDHGASLTLIDGNFNALEIDQLLSLFGKPIKACLSSHSHVDHINNLHCLEARGIPIFSPAAEHKYLLNIEILLQEGGADEQSARAEMKEFIVNELGFRNLTRVTEFAPDTVFADAFIEDEIKIASLPLPGHSPGHTGYLIAGPTGPDILFVADIGLDDFGAWYGFSYCNLADYRTSIKKLQKLYNPERQILISSHNLPHYPDNPGDFDTIITGLNFTEEKILQTLAGESGKTVADLTFIGLYYPLKALQRMRGGLRRLYYFWEFCSIQNHLKELEKRQKVTRIDDRWFYQG
ncbi:MAG: MBL fold metallo-hydrolase [Deltaproteobacteria bacterium]|nr:MBL fold metallo-hydrolase [Deltaproteobacteria bacterium]